MRKTTLSPYRKGMGPMVDVIFGDRFITIKSRVVGKPHATRIVFEVEAKHWRPGGTARSLAAQAAAIIGFAAAYAERGTEFDRSPDDYEQIESEWWERNGDAVQSEANHRAGIEE